MTAASTIDRLERLLAEAGFDRIGIEPVDDSERFIRTWDDDRDLSDVLDSASITGRKPP